MPEHGNNTYFEIDACGDCALWEDCANQYGLACHNSLPLSVMVKRLIEWYTAKNVCPKCGLNPNDRQDETQRIWEAEQIFKYGHCSACEQESNENKGQH